MKSKAFTLIELLVVVAIIALLVSILVPAVSKAKERALAVVCRTNLKQIHLGYSYYADNYNGVVASAYDYAAVIRESPGDTGARSWTYLIAEFIPSIMDDPGAGILYASEDPPKRRTIVHCPSVPVHGGAVLRDVNPNVYGNLREDYGANVFRSGRDNSPFSPVRYGRGGLTNFYTLQIKNDGWDLLGLEQTYIGVRAETYLVADSNYMDIETSYCIGYDAEQPQGFVFRHGGRRTCNMVFFDGHTEEVPYPAGLNTWPDNDPIWNTAPLERPW